MPSQVEPVEDRVDRRLGRALAVGVLDPQQHLAAASARVEPVEQRGAGAADMEEAGRRGGEAGDDGSVIGAEQLVATGSAGPCSIAGGRGLSHGSSSARLASGLAHRGRIWHIGAAQRGLDSRHVGSRSGRQPGRDFIRDIIQADLDAEAAHDRRHPLSAGAERLSAYRPRQVDLPEFRRRGGIRRPLPPALRRHQSDQGGAGIYRRHRARRALARLRLGQAPLSRVGLFRAALRSGPST